MRIAFIFTLCILFLGFKLESPIMSINHPDFDNPPVLKSIRYLALGDSYTVGEAVLFNQRWPVQLVDSLRKSGHKIQYPEIIAKTGWTTGELKKGIESASPKGIYQMVSLLIGVNNQYQKLDTSIYRTEFRELLETAIRFAGNKASKVMVVSIPDYGVTPFAQKLSPEVIAKEIDIYNQINREETKKYSARYIDITPLSKMAEDDPGLIAEDGLHPSGKMYKMWLDLIFPIAHQVIH
jgi:lysophospholipase L1-like esterase